MGQYLQAILALGFVIGLISLLSYFLRRFNVDSLLVKKGMNMEKSLSIVEILPLDSKRRLVIVKRGTKKHVLLLGAGNDMLLESFDETK